MLSFISIILSADFNNKINGKQIYMKQTIGFYKALGTAKRGVRLKITYEVVK